MELKNIKIKKEAIKKRIDLTRFDQHSRFSEKQAFPLVRVFNSQLSRISPIVFTSSTTMSIKYGVDSRQY